MTNRKIASKAQIIEMPSLKNNFGLTKTEFDQFAYNVRKGDDTLFLIVFNEQFNASITYLINKFTISYDLAYDVCMDTLLDFRSKLIQNKVQYGNLRFLFTRMAINSFIDGAKKDQKVRSAITVFLGNANEEEVDQELFFQSLQKIVESLDVQSQILLSDVYYSEKDANQIAEEHEISYATFRKRKQRILAKIKNSFSFKNENK